MPWYSHSSTTGTCPLQHTANSAGVTEVFTAFLKLGLTAFGGPIAHFGYFRAEFVERRGWVSDARFASLMAICQFLPGPASSQLGFSLGLLRAGWLGGLAAFLGFTLPSALLLIGFAATMPLLDGPISQAAISGLKLVACAVVADAVLGMTRRLCPDWPRRWIALLSAVLVLTVGGMPGQLAVILLAAVAAAFLLRSRSVPEAGAVQPVRTGPATDFVLPVRWGRRSGGLLLAVFVLLLILLPAISAPDSRLLGVAEAFYHAGALVFGGGHVVLPLLQAAVVEPGWVSGEQFLAGYGAAQAIPGPMFALSAYLGAVIGAGDQAALMASVALVFLFLPGFLLVAGVLPFWQHLSDSLLATNVMAGVNAAVVGLLAAALYDPILTVGVTDIADLAVAVIGFVLLAWARLSPLLVVCWCVAASVLPVMF